mmetsp:Transcript_8777/g.13134  ORF Transcript_8777/g.13134 Transcript_8777/m.13134 type:complete len:402 (-) Transcript_8777:207-1412(-)
MSGSDFGFLKIIIHRASFVSGAPDAPRDGEVYAELNLSNSSLVEREGQRVLRVSRRTESVSVSSPVWDDYIELRCGLGWDLSVCVFIREQSGSRHIYEVDNLVVGTCMSGTYYIRKKQEGESGRGAVCGHIEISLDFYPNHQSLWTLTKDCYTKDTWGKESLPHLLLRELGGMVQQQKQQNSGKNGNWSGLESSVEALSLCLSDDLSVLSEALLQEHHPSPSLSAGSSHTVSTVPPPDTMESYKVAALTRSFLLSLLQPIPKFLAPYPSVALIEKQLLIFSSALQAEERDYMSWDSVLRFVLLVSVWYLQHTYVALTLSEEYNMHPKELHVVRSRFERYDSHLSGDMSIADLPFLLSDMGEAYTEEEVAVLTRIVDADSIGLVEFPELIRWWCAESAELEE